MNITFINIMMRITFGGGENFDLNITRALKKGGHNIRFVIGVAYGYEYKHNFENSINGFETFKLLDDSEGIRKFRSLK